MGQPAPRPAPPLDEEVLAGLWRAWHGERQMEAREKLLAHYAPMVRQIVGRLKVALLPMVDRDDLESAGAIGLVKALDRYDPSRPVKFETFAFRSVQGGALDYVRQLDVLSRTGRGRIKKLKKTRADLRENLGRDPLDEELAEALEMSIETLHQVYFQMSHNDWFPLHNTGSAEEGEEDSTWETLADKADVDGLKALERVELLDQLQAGIEHLPDKERLLVSLYYYDDLNFKEIGRVLGVTESRVCQMHAQAMLQLGAALQETHPLPRQRQGGQVVQQLGAMDRFGDQGPDPGAEKPFGVHGAGEGG